MAKEQRIQVKEEEVTRNGHTVTVLTVGKNEIGFIEEAGDRFLAFVAGQTGSTRYRTMDTAVSALIAEYHLHHS